MEIEARNRQEMQDSFNEYVERFARFRGCSVSEVLGLKLVKDYANELGVVYTGGLK